MWNSNDVPPAPVMTKALMNQGGKAECFKSIESIQARDTPEGKEYLVKYNWEYDENDKGTYTARVVRCPDTKELQLMSWNHGSTRQFKWQDFLDN